MGASSPYQNSPLHRRMAWGSRDRNIRGRGLRGSIPTGVGRQDGHGICAIETMTVSWSPDRYQKLDEAMAVSGKPSVTCDVPAAGEWRRLGATSVRIP